MVDGGNSRPSVGVVAVTALWYVLNVKPNMERVVAKHLDQREDVIVFFPAIRVTPKNPRAAKIRPYFPGYLFVSLDLEELGSDALRWTPGTRGLVSFGGEPATVPEQFVQKLKKHLVERASMSQPEALRFNQGDQIRIVSGPLEGYKALFDMHLADRDRVQVLLTYLSDQFRRVKLDVSAITKVE